MSSSQIGLLGRKLGMTQVFDKNGNSVGVTVVEIKPNKVLQVKTRGSKDGYNAVQLGTGAAKESRTTKAQKGHYAKTDSRPCRFVREIRLTDATVQSFTPGKDIGITDVFTESDLVDVSGISKGRGFAGVFKRHNFAGFGRTHGAHEYKRHGGSIGTRLTPGMTFKGVRMPGHMGNCNVTIQNMQVVKIDADKNLVLIRGGVPGPTGGYVAVRKTVRNSRKAAAKK